MLVVNILHIQHNVTTFSYKFQLAWFRYACSKINKYCTLQCQIRFFLPQKNIWIGIHPHDMEEILGWQKHEVVPVLDQKCDKMFEEESCVVE